MKIEYNENPLASKVFLDDTEKQLLFWKYKWDMIGESVSWIEFDIREKKETNLDNIQNKLRDISEKFIETKYDEESIKYFIEELQSSHCGDCVYEPQTCAKCYAEEHLGIDSTPNLKHWGGTARKIMSAFSKNSTIEQAIDILKNKNYDSDEYKNWSKETDIDRWKQEDIWAIEYLEYYKKEILKK